MTELDERIAIDPALVAHLRDQVAGELTRIRQEREQRGAPELSRADEDQLTISVITSVVERHQTRAVMAGADLPDNALYDIALIDQLSKAILKSGRLSDLLEDPDVENIDINGCDEVWVTYAGRGKVRGVPVAATDGELVSMVQDLAAYQGINARPFSRAHPELDLRLGDGSRLSAVLGASERPVVSIRRNRFPEMSLHQLIQLESIDDEIATFLQAAIRSRMNIVVAGETNAGKTTLLLACINCIPVQERILTIERSLELGLKRQGRHQDVVEWEEVLPDTEGQGGISIQQLVRRSRRHNPDRVVVGEVLGPEVVEMLSAMSQGNDGSLSTLHARSALNVFSKLALYTRQYEGIDDAVAHTLVADSIDFVVFVARDRKTNRRFVTEIREVVGAPDGRVASTRIFGTTSRRTGCAKRDDEFAISQERADLLALEGYTDTGGGYFFEPRYEL
ncbi:MAG TPA: ATPase, T2SS/T4P/T4SS family [Mycobacterium sp.]